jgi:DNA (cytosine-5)-methyltransferase 1
VNAFRYDLSEVTVFDEFSGCGGTMQGASKVRYVKGVLAANHKKIAIESHAANFPEVDHYQGDVQRTGIEFFPWAALFLASPACPPWTDARGKKRDFDKSNQQVLFGDGPDEETTRNRLLMEEVPRYLRHWVNKGRPVLGGMVENVIQCRKWDQWDRWLGEIKALGYTVRVIAFNSMHARPVHSLAAPQSRCRLFIGYIHESVGRLPDWDKWLRPRAYCPSCDEVVAALQVFKNPRNDMGRYRQQYVYRCPRVSCRNRIIEPEVLPAYAAIDWSLKGQRIGDRAEPLADATLARIKAGIERYWTPLLTPAGGTWREDATSVLAPMPARTTRENDALAIPPLMVPVEGRPGKVAAHVGVLLRTQTARNETGLAVPPFLVPLRGGGDKENARQLTEPLSTVTASGNHHGLVVPPLAMVVRNNTPRGDAAQMCTPVTEELRTLTTTGHQSLVTYGQHLLVPYYGKGNARPASEPIGTFPTRDRFALAEGTADIALDDALFRMLEPHEIAAGMAFAADYIVLGNKRQKVQQLGNAVTPPVSEVIVSALVEAITGEDLTHNSQPAPPPPGA